MVPNLGPLVGVLLPPTPTLRDYVHATPGSRPVGASAGDSISISWQCAAEFIGRQAAAAGVLFEGEGWYSARELIISEAPAEAERTSHMTHQHVATPSKKKAAREERAA
jgi:hypothetical protein